MSWVAPTEASALGGILKLILNKDTKVEEVLCHGQFADGLAANNLQLIQYLQFHIGEVLDLCFSEESGEMGKRAFLVFSKSSERLLESLSSENGLFTRAKSVVERDGVSMCVISRLAGLLAAAVSEVTDSMAKAVPIILKLLDFCDNPSVTDMFLCLCEESSLKVQQKYLAAHGFAQALLSHLSHETDADRQYTLLAITCACCRGQVLARPLVECGCCQILYSLLSRITDTRVKGSLWQAISSIAHLSGPLIDDIECFIQPALAAMTDPYSFVDTFRIYATEYIARMASLQSVSLSPHISMTFVEVIVRLAVQFPDCTNLMGSLFRLAAAGFKWKEHRKLFVKFLLPYIILEASSKVRTSTAAHCAALLLKISDEVKESGDLESMTVTGMLHECQKKFLTEYSAKMKRKYGGAMQMDPRRTMSQGVYTSGY